MTIVEVNDIGIERELTDEELEDVFGGYFTRPVLMTRRDTLDYPKYKFDEPLPLSCILS